MSEIKKQIIEALKDQKEIFGDELFTSQSLKRKTTFVTKIKDEKELVDLAVEKLGLSSLKKFIKEEKIIDYMI